MDVMQPQRDSGSERRLGRQLILVHQSDNLLVLHFKWTGWVGKQNYVKNATRAQPILVSLGGGGGGGGGDTPSVTMW